MNQPVLFTRQPIFDELLNTYAYRLLYSPGNDHSPAFGPQNTADVMVNAFSNILERGHVRYLPALINCDADWLYDGKLPAVPVEALLLNVSQPEELDVEMVANLEVMASEGYRICVPATAKDELLNLAAIVRFSRGQQTVEELRELCLRFKKQGNKTLLAEAVDTYDDYEACKEAGCDLFLGSFFATPKQITGRKLSRNELVMFQLIGETNNPDATPESIEKVIQRDPELVAGLLRLVNSAAFRGRRTIASISEAIVTIGLIELRKWVLLFALCHNKQVPGALINELLVKGKFCELLAESNPQVDSSTAFMTGILSGIDAVLSIPLTELLDQLPVQVEVKRALNGGINPLGRLLTTVEAYLQGQWDQENTAEERMIRAYKSAIDWSNDILKDLG